MVCPWSDLSHLIVNSFPQKVWVFCEIHIAKFINCCFQSLFLMSPFSAFKSSWLLEGVGGWLVDGTVVSSWHKSKIPNQNQRTWERYQSTYSIYTTVTCHACIQSGNLYTFISFNSFSNLEAWVLTVSENLAYF